MNGNSANARYPCPFCGEQQSYTEARPSKPRVIQTELRRQADGTWRAARETVYDTECRACGERIVWSMSFGSGSMSEILTGAARYHWSKP